MDEEKDAKLAGIKVKLEEIGIKSWLILATADGVLIYDRSDSDDWIKALMAMMITVPEMRAMFKQMAFDVDEGRLSMEAIEQKKPSSPGAEA